MYNSKCFPRLTIYKYQNICFAAFVLRHQLFSDISVYQQAGIYPLHLFLCAHN
jgi:hypothetical protein